MPSIIAKIKEHPAYEPRSYYASKFPTISGNGSKALVRCCFHDDDDPSLSINLESGKWKCFAGCGHGDQIDFEARERNRSPDGEFLKELANELGIELTKRKKPTEPKEPFNLKEFAESKGLSPEALADINATEVERRGGSVEVCFPMVDASGEMVGYRRRFRRGKPRTNKGGNLGLIVPKSFSRESKRLYVTEGETDLAAAVSLGLSTVLATPGAGQCSKLLAKVTKGLKFEEVLFLADNDAPGITGARTLGFDLAAVGVDSRTWTAPKEGDDLRDWIKGGGTLEALEAAIPELTKFSETHDATGYKPESLAANAEDKEPTAPMLARDFLRMEKTSGAFVSFRYYKGEFFEFDGLAWSPLTSDQIRGELWRFSEQFYIRSGPTRTKVTNVCDGIRAEVGINTDLSAPFWIDPRNVHAATPIESGEYIVVNNGMLNTDSYELGKPSELLFNRNVIPVDYNPDAECTRWRGFLDEIFDGDLQRIKVLQEFFGYCTVPDNRYQRFAMLHGEGANGKSQVLSVLSSLLGHKNVSAVPIESFSARFALLPTIGMLLNICGDVPDLDRVAEGHIKAFTSGDPITVDRKHINAVTLRPSTKLALACNTLPRFHDRSEGIWRRMLLIPFLYVVPEDEQIVNLGAKIFAEESSGILNWTLDGRERLKEQGTFTTSEVANNSARQYKRECNTAELYVTENIVTKYGRSVATARVYRSYVDWCRDNGFRPLNRTHFTKELRKAFPHIKPCRAYYEGKQSRGFKDIEFDVTNETEV